MAQEYRAFRPRYPADLFDWLAATAPAKESALDVGCGNGQAAVAFADRFSRVFAIDFSREQIQNALVHPRVVYRVAPAEATGLPNHSVDLIVAAQAMHWFNLDRFYAEVRRVSRSGAVIAAFSYCLARIEPALDAIIRQLHGQIVGQDWPAERAHIESGYRTLPFPFPEIEAPPFEMEERWSCDQLLGYLRTWSAVARYRARTGGDPVALVEPNLRSAWGRTDIRRVAWTLAVRVGRAG